MTSKGKTILFLAIMLLFFAASASAKYITLTQTLSMEKTVSGTETSINITLLNQGDEAAHDVQLSLMLPDGMQSNPVFLGKMEPNFPQKADFNITLSHSLLPGRYSYAILTEYKDANSYPFSSVSPYFISLKDPRTTQIGGVISEQTIGTKGTNKITLNIRNMEDKERNLSVKIYGPKEIKIDPMQKTTKVGPRSEAKQDFDVSSFGALAGSSYVIFASMDYDESGIHYSSTAHGIIKVVEQKDVISFSSWLPYAVIAILIIVVVVYQFKK